MAGMDDFFSTLGSGIDLATGIQGMTNANQTNQQVQGSLGQNASTLAQQIAALQAQIGSGGEAARGAYDRARGLYDTENQGLQGNIDTMTSNLNSLNDPNSPYMQMARQKIERSDAAAGRRSQVGEREVQLAAMLADYVGKYAPGLNNSITGARNQITANQNSLAQLYAQMNNANTQQQTTLNDLLRQQQMLAQQQNTTGRTSQNATTNNTRALLQGALGMGKGLYGLFNSGGDSSNIGDGSISNYTPFGGGYGSGVYGAGITGDSLGSGSLGNFGAYDGGSNFLGGGNLFGGNSSGLFDNSIWGG